MPDKFNELLLKQDIIELYNAGITPDYGYLMNGRFEKDMIKTLYPLKTLSGNPISWEASDTEYLFPVVSFEPKQAGTGDPSPENVRPISGYDSVTVTQSKDEAQVKQITLTLPETIYGGTVDAVTGVGSKTYIFKELATSDMNHTEEYPGWTDQEWVTQVIPGEIVDNTLEELGCEGIINVFPNLNFRITPYFVLYLPPTNVIFPGLTQSQIKEQYPDLVVQFCLKLVNPEPFQASGNQALTIQPGNHTMYTDGSNISLSRKARRLEV